MAAITKAGFVVPPELQSMPGSNVAKNKHYDQIAYYKRLSRLKSTGRAGVSDFFVHVYPEQDEAEYAKERASKPGASTSTSRRAKCASKRPPTSRRC